MKSPQEFYDQFDTCREHDIPYCADKCPFKLDILDVQSRVTGKRFNAAYKTIRDNVAFPVIVSHVCPAYCEESCIRKIIDSPVQIKLMEQSIIELATRKKPNAYNLPARKQRVAVIGAGLSGLGFAFRMASKKYQVTIFERSSKVGGSLAGLMDEETYMAEIELQFKNEKYTLELDSEITDIHSLCRENDPENGFDVIYIATGKGGDNFGVPLPELTDSGVTGGCMVLDGTGVFIGGEVCGKDLMHALADGLDISSPAESYLKVKKLDYPVPDPATRCEANERDLVSTDATVPSGETFSEEECIAEAERCIRCKCNSCSSYCDLIGYFEKMPSKMRDEIVLSCKPAGSLVHKSPARKYVAACTGCGIMTELCPEDIDLCGMVEAARHKMHEADKVPAAYKQFFLRDMEFANGEYAAIKRPAPGKDKCSYAFFPGCNLGALDPEYVLRPYEWLLKQQPDTGLLLRCCGIPVNWAGNEEAHDLDIQRLRQDWMDLGSPRLITACISCQKHLREYLPEIEVTTLYEFMADSDFAYEEGSVNETAYAIFDPCSARNEDDIQASIRRLADSAGISTEELPEGDKHGCCGFGGQGSMVEAGFTKYIADKRIGLSNAPFLVYCSNCRDIFRDNGKQAIHILDVLFDIDPDDARRQPNVTERRINRVMLKEKLLNRIWSEEMDMKPEKQKYTLVMTPDTLAKADRQRILEDDICNVIDHAEEIGRRTLNPETGHYKAYREIGAITLWVEYSDGIPEGAEGLVNIDGSPCGAPDSPDTAAAEGTIRTIHNVYTHRMQIQLEAVFNGRKVDM